MKYKALKDVPYWGIKAGEVYEEGGGLTMQKFLKTPIRCPDPLPLLQAGIIEEHKPREPLTRENIKDDERYIHINLLDSRLFGYAQWDDAMADKELARAPIFRSDEEQVATDCYKAMCDFGFEWVKENYSKYY